jgi:hypothetical protein
MKKIFFIISLLLIYFSSISQISDSYTFDPNDLIFETKMGYDFVKFEECLFYGDIGAPMVPYFRKYYIIPSNVSVSSIDITNSTRVQIPGLFDIFPGQPDYDEFDTVSIIPFILPDSLIYNSSDPYPGFLSNKGMDKYFFGFQILCLNIYPLEYIPSDQELFLYTSISITVNFQPREIPYGLPSIITQRKAKIAEAYIKSIVENPNDFSFSNGGADNIVQNLDGKYPECIIVTTESLKPSFETLAEWKNQKGTPTIIFTLEEIQNNSYGCDIQEKIRNYVIDYCNKISHIPLFLLIGQDPEVIPMRKVRGSQLTDIYYSTIHSTWNENNNYLFGEDDDGLLFDYGYFTGRISVSNTDDANTVINKIIEYEKMDAENFDRDYVKNIACLSGFLGAQGKTHANNPNCWRVYAGRSHDEIFTWLESLPEIETYYLNDNPTCEQNSQEPLYTYTWNCPTTQLGECGLGIPSLSCDDCKIGDDVLNHDNSLNLFNAGAEFIANSGITMPHIFLHLDHSGVFSWGTGATLLGEDCSNNDIQNLTNLSSGPYHQIMFTCGCSANSYQFDCISEEYLNNPNGGGVGVIGSTNTVLLRVNIPETVDDYYTIYYVFKNFLNFLYDGSFQDLQTNELNFGNAFQHSISDVPTISDRIQFDLLGEPEMPIWTSSPVDFDVTIDPTSITCGDNKSIELTIDNLGDNTARICLYKEDEIYETIVTENQQNELNFNAKDIGELNVTIISQNFAPYISTINITACQEPYVYIKTFNPEFESDFFSGTQNNIMHVEMKNSGLQTANQITAILSCNNQYISLIDDEISLSSLNAQSSQYVEDDQWNFDIYNDCPNNEIIEFEVSVNQGSQISSETFEIIIKAPLATHNCNYIFYEDDVNHTFDGGETIKFNVELYNSGQSTCEIVNSIISELSGEYVDEFRQNSSFYEEISIYTSEINYIPFELVFKNFTNSPEVILLNLEIEYANGLKTIIPVNLSFKDFSNVVNEFSIGYYASQNRIKVFWDPVTITNYGYAHYNVYKLDPEQMGPIPDINDDSKYTKINDSILSYSFFIDVNVNPNSVYYYKIATVNEYGNEGKLCNYIMAGSKNPYHVGWPIKIPVLEFGYKTDGSPTYYDINDDETKEIFFTTGNSSSTNPLGALFGFYHDGTDILDPLNPEINELYNFQCSSGSTPAIYNFNSASGIEAFCTTSNPDDKRLCIDMNGNDLWASWNGLNSRGGLIEDVDNNSLYEIVLSTDWGKEINVINPESGLSNNEHIFGPEAIGEGIVVADIDGDIDKEIIIGKGSLNFNSFTPGLYIFKKNLSSYLLNPSSGLFYQTPNVPRNMDCQPIVANLDNNGESEIICLSFYDTIIEINTNYITVGRCRILALNHDNTYFSNWEYYAHEDIPLFSGGRPLISIGDVNRDGYPEIFLACSGNSYNQVTGLFARTLKLYGWDYLGNSLVGFPITVCKSYGFLNFAPLIADIDGNDDLEIVIINKKMIHAYKSTGEEIIKGWPLAAENALCNFTTSCIGDFDYDGYNEVMATAGNMAYMWDTEGDANQIEWGMIYNNSRNNPVYKPNDCIFDQNPIIITSANEIWDQYKVVNSNIEIKSGACLTIRSKVAMSEYAKISVEREGKLKVDGGLITTACGGLWKGIEVWGTPIGSQSNLNNYGEIRVYRGGEIRNAEIAISNTRKDNGFENPDFRGGIIRAQDASFFNNMCAIELMPCKNMEAEIEINNISYFKNCHFETNFELFDGNPFLLFVRMISVKGIDFHGCRFINSVPAQNYPYTIDRGYGLYCYDTDFQIYGYCDQPYEEICPNPIPSRFEGLYYGIYGHQISSNKTFTVDHAIFHNNYRGLYTCSSNNARITSNSFINDESGISGTFCSSYDLYLNYSTDYHVENNEFINTTTMQKGIGVIVNNSGEDFNEIYNNYFENLDIGINAQNNNKNPDPLFTDGLVIKCNEFVNVKYDIDVVTNQTTIDDMGIAVSQGTYNEEDPEAPAGNLFSNYVVPGDEKYGDYNNECEYIIYHHHDVNGSPSNIAPLPGETSPGITVTNIPGNDFIRNEACPPRLNEKSSGDLLDQMAKYSGLADSTEVLLSTFVDGGDTEALNMEVQTSTPEEALELWDELLQNSPYLSDTVMINAINKEDVLPPVMITEVLSVNPHAAKTNKVMNAVDQRNNPLSDEMIDQVEQGLNIIGAKEALEADLAYFKLNYHRSFKLYITQFMNDTIHTHSGDSICNLLRSDNSISKRYQLALYHLGNNDTTNAKLVMDSIMIWFDLAGTDLNKYQDYNSYVNIISDIYKKGNDILSLDSAHKSGLYSLASKNHLVGTYARNILQFTDTLSYIEPIIWPSLLKSNEQGQKNKVNFYNNKTIKVYPNPSNTYVIVEWNLLSLSDAVLSIYNMQGKIIESMHLNNYKGYKIISTKDYPAGVYFCRITGSYDITEITKFVIKH